MPNLTSEQARELAARYEAAMRQLAATHPDEARLMRNIVGAIRHGYVKGRQLTLARRLARMAPATTC